MPRLDGEKSCFEEARAEPLEYVWFIQGSSHGKRRPVVYRRYAAHVPLTDGDKIEISLVVLVNQRARAGILVAGNLQDECPV
jgi:hypothetical protein